MTDIQTAKDVASATKVAEKIATKVSETLAPLAREMVIMKWPAEFRVIMWNAVAQYATGRARSEEENVP